MTVWTGQTITKIHAVRAGGNTLLRVRYEEPVGDCPAACHVRAVLAAFLTYVDQKGVEWCEKREFSTPTYTVRVATESLRQCMAVYMTFSFADHRPPVVLSEYWRDGGKWQVAKPPRGESEGFTKKHKNLQKNSTQFS